MRFPTICLLAALICLATSCKRIEAKLDRLARLAGITTPAEADTPKKKAEPVLTPEQQALEAKVLSPALFLKP
jgi:hypothetical protein